MATVEVLVAVPARILAAHGTHTVVAAFAARPRTARVAPHRFVVERTLGLLASAARVVRPGFTDSACVAFVARDLCERLATAVAQMLHDDKSRAVPQTRVGHALRIVLLGKFRAAVTDKEPDRQSAGDPGPQSTHCTMTVDLQGRHENHARANRFHRDSPHTSVVSRRLRNQTRQKARSKCPFAGRGKDPHPPANHAHQCGTRGKNRSRPWRLVASSRSALTCHQGQGSCGHWNPEASTNRGQTSLSHAHKFGDGTRVHTTCRREAGHNNHTRISPIVLF